MLSVIQQSRLGMIREVTEMCELMTFLTMQQMNHSGEL